MNKQELEKKPLTNPDWVSDCCGSGITVESNMQPEAFTCRHCKKPCQVKQLHDIQILKVKQYDR